MPPASRKNMAVPTTVPSRAPHSRGHRPRLMNECRMTYFSSEHAGSISLRRDSYTGSHPLTVVQLSKQHYCKTGGARSCVGRPRADLHLPPTLDLPGSRSGSGALYRSGPPAPVAPDGASQGSSPQPLGRAGNDDQNSPSHAPGQHKPFPSVADGRQVKWEGPTTASLCPHVALGPRQ